MLHDQVVRVVGAMSGTSLDGVDAAEILTDGHVIIDILDSRYLPYTQAQRTLLQSALGKWPSDELAEVCEVIETVHAQALAPFKKADMIGFHGQTLAHDPQGVQGPPRTHQAGDGAVLAEVLGKLVVWDFRSADVEMGGEGAPLAPFYHFALAQKMGATEPVVFLNLGGVGNITWVDPKLPHPESEGALLAFDTGPANAPINDLVRKRLGKDYDENGELAASGTPNQGAIEAFLKHPYFLRLPPKSLDRDAFSSLLDAVEELSTADAAATLTAACAAAVAQAISLCPSAPKQIITAGGGRHNATLMKMIADNCSIPTAPIEDFGFDGDMIEAQAFAFLAVRTAKGLPTSSPSTTGVTTAIGGGTLSRPAVNAI